MTGLNVREGGGERRERGGEREEGREERDEGTWLRGTQGPRRLASVPSSLFAQHNGMSAL